LAPTAVALAGADVAAGTPVTELLAAGTWPLLAVGSQRAVARARGRLLVATASGLRVGYVAVDPVAAADAGQRADLVRAEVTALRAANADVVVVLSDLGLRASRRLIRAVAGIDVVVVGGVPERIEPDLDPMREDDTLLLQATRHGAWAATLTLARNGGGPSRWLEVSERLPAAVARLDERIAAVRAGIARLTDGGGVSARLALPFYQRQLDDLIARRAQAVAVADQPLPTGTLAAYQAVDLPWSTTVDIAMAALVARYDGHVAASADRPAPAPVPARAGEPVYLGGAVCLGCHTEAAAFATSNRHAHAWQTLVEAHKTRDLDCVPCHVTGFGAPGGSAFANLDVFANVQCEACHGPGSAHAAAPATRHLDARPGESRCRTCHTAEHAPRFDFAVQVRALRVPGHGLPVAPVGSAGK